jgi:hypothetical protein
MAVGRAERRRRRSGAIVAIVIVVAALGAIALLVVRPVRLTGVSTDALEASLKRTLDGPLAPTCEELRGDRRRCIAATGDSGRRSYAVHVDGWGCWEARTPGEDAHESCIWARDFVDIE